MSCADLQPQHLAVVAVTHPGLNLLLPLAFQILAPVETVVPGRERKPMLAERPGQTPRSPEMILAGPPGDVRMVEEDTPRECDLEIEPAQIDKIVADTQLEVGIAVIDDRPGRRQVRESHADGDVTAIAMEQTVLIGELSLENMLADIIPCGGTDAVGHADGIPDRTEVVADVGITPRMVEITQRVTGIVVLRRNVEIELGIERVPRPGLEVAPPRTVELPISDRSGADGPSAERSLDGQRRDGIVDVGIHEHRIGHVGLDRELDGALQTGHVSLGHLDHLFDLRRSSPERSRDAGGGYEAFFHGQFIF